MTTRALQARILELRRAGTTLQRLGQGARLAALGRVLDAWSDAGSSVRRRLLDEHPPASGLSRENLAAGLELALSDWDHSALERLLAAEAAGAEPLAGVTTVIHGGVLPMPTLIDALSPLVLGSPVIAKPASRDPVTPRLVARSIAELAPELGECIAVVDVRRGDGALTEILAVERVLMTGSDEAIAAVRAQIPRGTRLIAHGHKISVAVLGESEEVDRAAERLALDVSLWDQLGCLSPIACWTLGGPERARAFATALANALQAREGVAPRGEVSVEDAARLAEERSKAELRVAAGADVELHAGDAWTVIAEADPTPGPAPLHRFVRVHPLANTDSLPTILGRLGSYVAGLAYAGFEEREASELGGRLGASRTAPFGRLQAPPIEWARDGLGVLSSIVDA